MNNEIKILRLVEKQPLTVQNITDSFDLTVEDVIPIMKHLLDRGLINILGRGFLKMVQPCKAVLVEPSTHFTLTLKGHFKVNPVIIIKNADEIR